MDMMYLEYCYADPYFYDTAHGNKATALGRTRRYQLDQSQSWEGWTLGPGNGWFHASPKGIRLPDQGWKVHCSATLENAQQILKPVSRYCGENKISFKFLPSSADVVRANVKYAPRGGSGKFITIYPQSVTHAEQVLRDLDALIGGMEGPYILSDLRFKNGPLYLRYGGFRQLYVRNEMDDLVPAIRRPDGVLVPDHRLPVFSPPDWVELPGFVTEMQQAMGTSSRPDDFPYEITDALHFSNGGGIYKGRSIATGLDVVLNEARPHAGLSPDGHDAVRRLKREVGFLRQFADVDHVVKIRDEFTAGGHSFLVEDFVEGITLNKEMVMRNPLIRTDQRRQDRIEYRDWAMTVMDRVEKALHTFHDRGIVFGDLHPNNILITKDGDPVFIDFEMAYEVDDPNAVPAGAPGYMPNDGRIGVSADLYALGCTKLALFIPLTVLIPLDPPKLGQMILQAKEAFELPAEYCDSILRDIGARADGDTNGIVKSARSVIDTWDMSSPQGVQRALDGIAEGVWESADFSRLDRIFPGDPHQFIENGIGIAYGACGNLLAHRGTESQRTKVLDWIEEATRRLTSPNYGFFDGVAGIVHTLRSFGRDEAADLILDKLLNVDFEHLTSDLYGGLSGIGIFLVEEFEVRPTNRLEQAASRVRDLLAQRLRQPAEYIHDVNGNPTAATGKAGLMRGLAGQALYWIRSFEHTSNEIDLDRAEQALDVDLSLCVKATDGSVQLNEGWRTLPYIASGSIGIGLVLSRLREHRDRPGDREMLAGIIRCTGPEFAIQSNLFNGRAGFVYFLSSLLNSRDSDLVSLADLERHVRLLGMYAVLNRTGIHFPGEQIMRLSTDWATGSAGVHAVLERYKNQRFGETAVSIGLPFLGLESPAHGLVTSGF